MPTSIENCIMLLHYRLTIGERLSAPGPVHYSDVSCDGTEESLIDCENSLSTSTDHSTDVYIVCSPGNILYSGDCLHKQCHN